jgi:nucleotide-binding universal stress UspA family protein
VASRGACIRFITRFTRRATYAQEPDALLRAPTNDLRRTVEERMSDAIASLGDGVEISGRLLDGDPATEAVNASTDLDLLVLGSRGYGPVRTVLLRSVSRTLVREGACSVVVLPRGASTKPLVRRSDE